MVVGLKINRAERAQVPQLPLQHSFVDCAVWADLRAGHCIGGCSEGMKGEKLSGNVVSFQLCWISSVRLLRQPAIVVSGLLKA